MTGYVLTPRAKADIAEIWDYTIAVWGIGQSETYLRRIQAAMEAVAVEPSLARSCEAIRAGYWKHPAGSHVIFFRLSPDGIEVIRILHSRIDFDRHL